MRGLYLFQSLFYWMFLLKISSNFNSPNSPNKFQSLFYWMFLLKDTGKGGNMKIKKCFNPCFIGCSS